MFASNGWFSIKLQLRVSIAGRCDTAGFYVVTNVKISRWFWPFVRADCLPEKLTSDSILSISCLG